MLPPSAAAAATRAPLPAGAPPGPSGPPMRPLWGAAPAGPPPPPGATRTNPAPAGMPARPAMVPSPAQSNGGIPGRLGGPTAMGPPRPALTVGPTSAPAPVGPPGPLGPPGHRAPVSQSPRTVQPNISGSGPPPGGFPVAGPPRPVAAQGPLSNGPAPHYGPPRPVGPPMPTAGSMPPGTGQRPPPPGGTGIGPTMAPPTPMSHAGPVTPVSAPGPAQFNGPMAGSNVRHSGPPMGPPMSVTGVGMPPPPVSGGPSAIRAPPMSSAPPMSGATSLSGPTGPVQSGPPVNGSVGPPVNGAMMRPNGPVAGPPMSAASAPPVNGPVSSGLTRHSRPSMYPPAAPSAGPYPGLTPPAPQVSHAGTGMPPVSTNGMNGPNSLHNNAGYQQPQQPQQPQQNRMQGNFRYSLASSGVEPVDLIQNRHILPPKAVPPTKIKLQSELANKANCSPDVFRCTLTKIPETETVLKKSRLPLGVMIHPFKDLSHLPVIQCSTIVRCRQCRTYINPFVQFVDQRRWRCNICYRVNDLPEEFLYDPVSKSYGDPSRRPEIKSSTIEFIAPSEYMLRPPQPAVYVFLLDVSRPAVESGYLKVFCQTMLDELDKLPGDARTQVSFITYDRSVHFYSMPEDANQPTQLNVSDVDDVFLPSPSDLLVNLHSCRELVIQLLTELPGMFRESYQTDSALGAALQAAFKMTAPTGGRITVFQCSLPSIGPGKVEAREGAGGGAKDAAGQLGPQTDFYKKLALDCSGQQIAVDLFTLSSQYVDLATLSGVSKFSGGQVQHFSGYHLVQNTPMAAKFENALRRYLVRKIGFEAVMRIRCTRGLTPHTFHGNFFVRSTDLLSLPNINPDAGFAMQVSIEDDLRDSSDVSFQAALLYTSSKGERRIRVHTLCVPTTASVVDVINSADHQAIVGMLSKFSAERAINDSLSDAKEGLVVSTQDTLDTYKTYTSISTAGGLLASMSLRLMPLYTLACMRAPGFRSGQRLDDRLYCFSQFKTLPLIQLIQYIYPDLYRVDDLTDEGSIEASNAVDSSSDEDGDDESSERGVHEVLIPQPPRLQLSFERVSATGMYLMDWCDTMYLYVSRGLHQFMLERVFGVTRLHEVDETMTELPELENPESERLRTYIQWLNGFKPYPAALRIIREDGKTRHFFIDRMIEDRCENSFSYFEFLQHLKKQLKS